tara:strand:+ start:139221 stop:140468 length:1248 start_codon:yes stop_codon:yes gene_type:complete
MIISLGIMLLPWTQNINSRGSITTLSPDQRPQNVHSVIAGQIERWYVREGDYVQKGDTIVHIKEIKDAYFDPLLLERTQQQLEAKKNTIRAYEQKLTAMEHQIKALRTNRQLKLEQLKNYLIQAGLKVQSDSMEVEAAKLNLEIAKQQFDRMKGLYEEGLKSLTDFEKRKLDLQKAEAEMIAKQNKLLTSRNLLINAQIDLNTTEADFEQKIAKAESDMFTAQSNLYGAQAEVAKLENQYSNYQRRNDLYFVTAPQSGYITQSIKSGIGETLKEGEVIVTIMPESYQLAVEMYVRPIDLPLLKTGQKVRIQFDGWPAIVFSGWPNTSFGTYGGEIFAIDRFISANGMYRVLVRPDEEAEEWPEALRYGSGAQSIVLLNEVPIWYEVWRQINGFPPDYYSTNTEKSVKSSFLMFKK